MSEHRKRILDRILRPNFIGAIIGSKDILVSKVNLFDVTADIMLHHTDNDLCDVLIMNYGDYELNFQIEYEYRMNSVNCHNYIVRRIK